MSTVAFAAQKLGVAEELVLEIHGELGADNGAIWIYDTINAELPGFTNRGIRNLEDEIALRLPNWRRPSGGPAA